MPSVTGLAQHDVREALELLGCDVPTHRSTAVRELRELLGAPGTVRTALDRAPEGARAAFLRLVQDGPAPVEELLGRGWWGRGMMPPPLDWLQRRGFALVGEDGLVYATDEARNGFVTMSLGLSFDEPGPAEPAPVALRVEATCSVVVASTPAVLDRALCVADAALRAIAPTVAVSARASSTVSAALRAAGISLDEGDVVEAQPDEPALPSAMERAVGPRAVRALLQRAVVERRQVRLQYFASSRGGAATDRVVDPWTFADDLLRGFCHLRSDERAFAVDRVGSAVLLPTPIEHPAPA